MTLWGRKLHSRQYHHGGSFARVQRSLPIRDLIVVSDGDDRQVFLHRRLDNRFRCHSRVFYVVGAAIGVNMEVATMETCAVGECFDLTNIQGDYLLHYDPQPDGKAPVIMIPGELPMQLEEVLQQSRNFGNESCAPANGRRAFHDLPCCLNDSWIWRWLRKVRLDSVDVGHKFQFCGFWHLGSGDR